MQGLRFRSDKSGIFKLSVSSLRFKSETATDKDCSDVRTCMRRLGGKMEFGKLKTLIRKESKSDDKTFDESSARIQEKIFALSKKQTVLLLKNIGIIPESIHHDSSEEKLFAKVADILLAKAFQEIGLSANVNDERANCADVVAKSKIHKYSLVADAKAFRLSRTAKNQKDFKVKSMVDWKGGHDYSVLVCPFYQYPRNRSQIYGQALDGNVCLLSWEHLVLFLENNIKETKRLSLRKLWNISDELSSKVTVKNKDRNTNFHQDGNLLIQKHVGLKEDIFGGVFELCRKVTVARGRSEIKFWKSEIDRINGFTRKQAITELLDSMKIGKKISTIQKYIDSLA